MNPTDKAFFKLAWFIAIAGFLLVGFKIAKGEDAPVTPEAATWSFSATPTYVSQYMFRGQLIDGSCLQPDVEADYGDAAIGVWASTPLANKIPGSSDPEIDLYGSWKYGIIEPGFTLYTYPRAAHDRGTFEPSVALVYTVAGVSLTPKIYYDLTLHVSTFELTAGYTVQAPIIRSELDFLLAAGAYSGDSTGNYWTAGFGIPFTITKASKLTIGIAYAEGWSFQGTVGRGIVSASYNYSF